MKIQVLGSGCPKCQTLHKKVQEAVDKLGMDAKVEYSTDITEIVKLGAMSSPVFAIDGVVMTAGKVPDNNEIEQCLRENCPPKNAGRPGSCGCNCNCEDNC